MWCRRPACPSSRDGCTTRTRAPQSSRHTPCAVADGTRRVPATLVLVETYRGGRRIVACSAAAGCPACAWGCRWRRPPPWSGRNADAGALPTGGRVRSGGRSAGAGSVGRRLPAVQPPGRLLSVPPRRRACFSILPAWDRYWAARRPWPDGSSSGFVAAGWKSAWRSPTPWRRLALAHFAAAEGDKYVRLSSLTEQTSLTEQAGQAGKPDVHDFLSCRVIPAPDPRPRPPLIASRRGPAASGPDGGPAAPVGPLSDRPVGAVAPGGPYLAFRAGIAPTAGPGRRPPARDGPCDRAATGVRSPAAVGVSLDAPGGSRVAVGLGRRATLADALAAGSRGPAAGLPAGLPADQGRGSFPWGSSSPRPRRVTCWS